MTSRSTTPRKAPVKKAPVKKAAPARKRTASARRTTSTGTTVTALPTAAGSSATSSPEPLRPLGVEGKKMWTRVWASQSEWINTGLDIDHVTLLCESMDERVALRVLVLRKNEWRDRVALRQLDDQIERHLGALGLNPSARAQLKIAAKQPGGADPIGDMRNGHGKKS